MIRLLTLALMFLLKTKLFNKNCENFACNHGIPCDLLGLSIVLQIEFMHMHLINQVKISF